MLNRLPESMVNGGFQVAAVAPFTILSRIPKDARGPAMLTVLNTHSTAVLYMKWIPLDNTGQVFETGDAAIVLTPGRSYTWEPPPSNRALLCRSSVAGAVAAVDGSWQVPASEEERE